MPDANGRGVPSALAAWMEPFRAAFTAPTRQYVMVLVMGAILVPGRRTVASALRVIGLEQVAHFSNYHRVLNRNIWSGRRLSRRLLVDAFVLDDTIERRWGARIKARGIYRDPVRSSQATSSRRAACAGSRSCCCPRFLGPGVAGHSRF